MGARLNPRTILLGGVAAACALGLSYYATEFAIDFGVYYSIAYKLTKSNQKWVAPFVGLRTQAGLSKRALLVAEGSVGGFGAGSDFSWKALGAFGFNVSRRFAILGGYRALGQDYDNSDEAFEWDMVIHGPILGFQLTF